MKKIIATAALIGVFSSCMTMNEEPFHKTVDFVDLERFTGDWYIIALIPTPFETKAVNGIENYSITREGNIRVKYVFRKNSPQGKEKTMYQKGWIYNKQSHADWRVSPLWPLKLPYYILELDKDYTYTVIGTNNFNYLWIMSRTPGMEKDLLEQIINRMVLRGYDRKKIQHMEQHWS